MSKKFDDESPFGNRGGSYNRQVDSDQENVGTNMGGDGDGYGDDKGKAKGKKKGRSYWFKIILGFVCVLIVSILIAILVIVIMDLNNETNSSSSGTTDISPLEKQIQELKISLDTFQSENHNLKSQVNNLSMQLLDLKDLKNKLASLGGAQQEQLLNEIYALEKKIKNEVFNIQILMTPNGRLSPASLDVSTVGCPTTFGEKQCKEATFWTLSKTTSNDMTSKSIDLQTPNITADFKFKVKVTEDDTRKFLSGDIMLFITNSGGQTVQLSSIVLNLEKMAFPPGTGDAPGSSGKDWKILLSALQNLSPLCNGKANICNKKKPFLIQDSGDTTSMMLLDPFSNDMISMGDIFIPPSTNFSAPCDDRTLITVRYRFDITQLCEQNPTLLTDLVRFHLLVTFVAGGKRGGTCEVDADCDGSIEDDEEHTRTIKQRSEFRIQQCSPTCKHVELVDPNGPIVVQQTPPSPPECVNISDVINPISTVLTIWGTGNDGFETKECINATVECITANCTAVVSNTAILSGEGCTDFNAIQGSPASASLTVNCGEIEPKEQTFCTLAIEEWRSTLLVCSSQLGVCDDLVVWGQPQVIPFITCFIECHGNEVFPSGNITIGRIILGRAIRFTDSPSLELNINRFIGVGFAAPFFFTHAGLLINPVSTSAGVLAAELLAATFNFNYTLHFQGDAILSLRFTPDCPLVNPYFRGKLLSEVIFIANVVVSDIFPKMTFPPTPLSFAQGKDLRDSFTGPGGNIYVEFSTALNLYNNEFINCQTIATGCLITS